MVEFLNRLPDGNAFDEVGRLVDRRPIGAIEGNLDRFLLEPSLVEDILEPRTFPSRAAHRTVTPFDADHMRLR